MPTVTKPKGEGVQAASNRMQVLTEAAHHLFIVNHPEKPVDMELIKDHDLDVTEKELPVVQQLIRDEQAAESVASDGEDLPKTNLARDPLLEPIPAAMLDPPKIPELDPKTMSDPPKIPELDTTTASPVAKRAKVMVNISPPNSPVIFAKKPKRASTSSNSPLGTLKGKINI